MERADVLIVGAGLAGASLAWHVADRRSVLVLEQGEQPLAEASAQNAGMVRRLVAGAHERELACRSHARMVDAATLPEWRERQPFRPTGAVVALVEDRGPLPGAAGDLARRGVRVEELAADRLAAIAPALRGGRFARAFWLPDEGVCDAWSLGQGFLRGAIARGARVECGRRVTALVVERGRVVGATSDRGAVRADVVVLAAGAWCEELGASAGVRRTLVPKARHLLQSAPHPTSTRGHPWCWIDDAGIYVRPEAGGFLCSPCDEDDRYPSGGPGSAGAVDAYGKALALDKLARYLPALADLRFAGGWTGLRTFTPSRRFQIGFDPDVAGLFWVAGLGGAGLTCAFAIGEDAAQALETHAPATVG